METISVMCARYDIILCCVMCESTSCDHDDQAFGAQPKLSLTLSPLTRLPGVSKCPEGLVYAPEQSPLNAG